MEKIRRNYPDIAPAGPTHNHWPEPDRSAIIPSARISLAQAPHPHLHARGGEGLRGHVGTAVRGQPPRVPTVIVEFQLCY